MMNSRPSKPRKTGPFAGLGNLLSSKPFLAFFSALLALVIWSLMVTSDSTLTRPKYFSNAEISVTGESTLKSRGYIVLDDLDEVLPDLEFGIEVSQSNYSRASASAYNPHIDLGDIKGEGENEVSIQFSTQVYGPVISCEPAFVKLNVERYITRRVPVVLELTGSAPEGTYLDSYKTDPTMLSVSGPASIASLVSRAVIRLDASELDAERMTDRTALPVTLQDTAGAEVVSDKLEITNQTVITDAVVVETELIPMKQVPISLDGCVTGEPAEGYELTGVTCSSEKLDVAAKHEYLDSILSLTFEQPLDITGCSSDTTGALHIRKPSNIRNTLPGELNVTAHIQEKTIDRTFRQVSIETTGTSDGLSCSLSREHVTVQITGPYHFVNSLSREDLQVYVETDTLEPGVYTLPVRIRIDNAPEFTCALSVSEIKATVK